MRLCFDTNVVIDILCGRADLKASFAAYDIATVRGDGRFVPMFATSDIHYILHNSLAGSVHSDKAIDALFRLFAFFDGHSDDCARAHASVMPDYEDALLAHAAARNGINYIITRNKRDFADSPVAALTPDEYVQAFQPPGYSYDLVEL